MNESTCIHHYAIHYILALVFAQGTRLTYRPFSGLLEEVSRSTQLRGVVKFGVTGVYLMSTRPTIIPWISVTCHTDIYGIYASKYVS